MRRSELLAAAALLLATALLFAPTLRYDFTGWDDPEYVLENPLIRTLDLPSLGAIFTHYYAANYAPLHLASYAVLYAAVGPAPWAFHALNLALHALCTVLVFLLLRRLALPLGAASLGAAIFLAHPAQVEAVAWVNQTKTLLETAFGFGALLLLLRARRLRGAGAGGGAAGWSYAGALALFACALLSKPQAVALPGIFFCVERALPDRDRRLPLAGWIPFAALALGFAWIAVRAQGSFGGVKAYGPLGIEGSLLRSIVIFADYLRITFLPVDLSVLYEVRRLRTLLDPRLAAARRGGSPVARAGRLRGAARPGARLGAAQHPDGGSLPLPGALRGGLARRRRLARAPPRRPGGALGAPRALRRPHPGAHAGLARRGQRVERRDRRAPGLRPRLGQPWDLPLLRGGSPRRGEGLSPGPRAGRQIPRGLDGSRARAGGAGAIQPGGGRLAAGAGGRAPGRLAEAAHRARSRPAREERGGAGAHRDGDPRPAGLRGRLPLPGGRARDAAGAEADLERTVALDPFVADAYAALGRLREERGDVAGARAAYIDFLKYWGGDLERADAVRERLAQLR
jgi:hypothetical protein